MHIRDPIHGAIEISDRERRLIDTPYLQRLRHVRQLGFTELAFPGATHTRYAHVVGAMEIATRVFDAVFRTVDLPGPERARYRQALRLAVLLHDLGHPPFSHCSEQALPMLSEVGLPGWLGGDEERRATHEELTLKMVLDSGLRARLEEGFAKRGIEPEAVAALIRGRTPPTGPPFVHDGIDYTPLLRQMVSSEIDADRMDYLIRDSFFTGVSYGKFDLDWIVQNLGLTVVDGRAWLALDRRAILAFEDFLLSRYHMFMAVYFHRTSVAYEEMLLRFYRERPEEYRLPADPEAYLAADDVQVIAALRASDSEWARRIVERRGYRPVYEEHPGDPPRAGAVRGALESEGFDLIFGESRGMLSRYLRGGRDIFVKSGGSVVPIEDYTDLFQRYPGAATLVRIYVAPEHRDAALAVVRRVTGAR